MIPKAAIEKAVSGGWKEYICGAPAQTTVLHYDHDDIPIKGAWLRIESKEGGSTYDCWQAVALDKTFWEALRTATHGECACREDEGGQCMAWLNTAGEFVHLILTGQDTTEFWSSLLQDNKEK